MDRQRQWSKKMATLFTADGFPSVSCTDWDCSAFRLRLFLLGRDGVIRCSAYVKTSISLITRKYFELCSSHFIPFSKTRVKHCFYTKQNWAVFTRWKRMFLAIFFQKFHLLLCERSIKSWWNYAVASTIQFSLNLTNNLTGAAQWNSTRQRVACWRRNMVHQFVFNYLSSTKTDDIQWTRDELTNVSPGWKLISKATKLHRRSCETNC